MFTKIDEFTEAWGKTSTNTLKMLHALTDESLNQAVADDHRTLGRVAWHITMTIPEMAEQMGLDFGGFKWEQPVPKTAQEIVDTYLKLAKTLIDRVKLDWDDDVLTSEVDMYGEKWQRGFGLRALVEHEIHHRGQMTVLMRQAGIRVPGLYGPAKEDWAAFGQEEPPV